MQVVTSSKKSNNLNKFRTYAYETYVICVEKYGWFTVPPSVHKLLLHAADIMEELPLPIEDYGEEALEGNNKVFRKVRLMFSRMTDRKHTNEDVLKRLLVNTDPYVAQFRTHADKDNIEKTSDAKEMLS